MPRSAGALRLYPGFRRYLAARVVSTAGTLVTVVVLPVLVYRLTGSAGWTAAVVAAEALPHLLLGPLAAGIAARFDHGKLLRTADLAGAALLSSIPLAWWYGGVAGWQVVAVAGAMQVVFLLLDAAQVNALHALVGPELTAAGRTALRGATGLVELMMPPLAGLAVTIAAPAPLLVLDAVSFLASALLVRGAVRGTPVTPVRTPVAGRVRAGLRFLRGHRAARTLALAGLLHTSAGAVYLAVLLPWADRRLGVPPFGDARLALLVSCWGLGAIVGSAVFPALVSRLGALRLARKGLLASLVGALGVLLCTNWLPAALAGLLWGATYTVAAKATMTALGAPARSAARLLARGVGPILGAGLGGALAMWSTPRVALAAGVGLLAIAALVVRRIRAPVPPGPAPRLPPLAKDGTGDCTSGQRPNGP